MEELVEIIFGSGSLKERILRVTSNKTVSVVLEVLVKLLARTKTFWQVLFLTALPFQSFFQLSELGDVCLFLIGLSIVSASIVMFCRAAAKLIAYSEAIGDTAWFFSSLAMFWAFIAFCGALWSALMYTHGANTDLVLHFPFAATIVLFTAGGIFLVFATLLIVLSVSAVCCFKMALEAVEKRSVALHRFLSILMDLGLVVAVAASIYLTYFRFPGGIPIPFLEDFRWPEWLATQGFIFLDGLSYLRSPMEPLEHHRIWE